MYDAYSPDVFLDLINPAQYEFYRSCLHSDKPTCYIEEDGNPYPLCVGRKLDICKSCSLWAGLQPDFGRE